MRTKRPCCRDSTTPQSHGFIHSCVVTTAMPHSLIPCDGTEGQTYQADHKAIMPISAFQGCIQRSPSQKVKSGWGWQYEASPLPIRKTIVLSLPTTRRPVISRAAAIGQPSCAKVSETLLPQEESRSCMKGQLRCTSNAIPALRRNTHLRNRVRLFL